MAINKKIYEMGKHYDTQVWIYNAGAFKIELKLEELARELVKDKKAIDNFFTICQAIQDNQF